MGISEKLLGGGLVALALVTISIFTPPAFCEAEVGEVTQTRQSAADPPTVVLLTGHDKTRIRLEEVYRHEVRSSFQEKKGSLLKLLNAPFTIWLFSSVFLAGVTALYAQYTKRRETESNNTERVKLIIIELVTRIERAKIDLPKVEKGSADEGIITHTKKTFTEFEDRDFYSIAVELQMRQPDDHIPKQLVEVWQKVMNWPSEGVLDLLEEALSLLKEQARITGSST